MRPASRKRGGSRPLTPQKRMGSAEKRSCSGGGQGCFPCLGSTSKERRCSLRQIKMLPERMLTNLPKQKPAHHAKGVLYEIKSNAQVEGQITRLKLLKRQMYGKAHFGLLRVRVLHAA